MTRISKEKIAMGVIKSCRKLLSNSPANNWPVSSTIKGRIFRYAHKDPELEVEYKGVKLRVPTADTCLSPGIVGGYYESIELDIFKMLASVSKSILDVGGNIGLYATIGAKNIDSGGRVVTFEPISTNIAYMENNLALNDLRKNVKIEKMAVGETSGSLDLYISKNNVGNHSASELNVVDSIETVSVKKVSLDNYCEENSVKKVDILKIDVEGYDGFVLDGAMGIIRRHKPTLFIEYIPKLMTNCGYNPDDFISKLFGTYDDCYLVNEATDSVVHVEQEDIKDFTSRVRNSNLIFVQNKKHGNIIKSFAK